jgi:AraC-like DNA-binding protein
MRQLWLEDVVKELQLASGSLSLTDAREACAAAIARTSQLAPPRSQAERLMLQTLLIEFAYTLGTSLHVQFHSRYPLKCTFSPIVQLERFCHTGKHDLRWTFAEWAKAYCEAFERTHNLPAAYRIARLIERDYHRTWSLLTLSRTVELTPAQVSRAFRREYGMSPREYLQALRMLEAAEHVGNMKIEAVALQVGYKSKKNFYRAFQRFTGVTPAAFRRLPKERARHLIKSRGVLLKSPLRESVARYRD